MLLYNSRLRLFPGKLKSRWEGPYEVIEAYSNEAVKIKRNDQEILVNGHRLKEFLANFDQKKDVMKLENIPLRAYRKSGC